MTSNPQEAGDDDGSASAEAEWICTKCGEANPIDFGLCWKCQASAPEPVPDTAE